MGDWELLAIADQVRPARETEMLRLFLLGEQPFPAQAVLLTMIALDRAEIHNQVLMVPVAYKTVGHHRAYGFAIPGITFQLLLGAKLPPRSAELCTQKSGLIFATGQNDDAQLQRALRLIAKSEKRGRFREDDRRKR